MAQYIAMALCPHLKIVRNRMSRYVEMSKQVMDVFRDFDENMAPGSLDEAYIE